MRAFPTTLAALGVGLLFGCAGCDNPADLNPTADTLAITAALESPTSEYRWDLVVTMRNMGTERIVLSTTGGCFLVPEIRDSPGGTRIWPDDEGLNCTTISIQFAIEPGDSLVEIARHPPVSVQEAIAGHQYFLVLEAVWDDPTQPPTEQRRQRTVEVGWVTFP